jgi:hypothetical protein
MLITVGGRRKACRGAGQSGAKCHCSLVGAGAEPGSETTAEHESDVMHDFLQPSAAPRPRLSEALVKSLGKKSDAGNLHGGSGSAGPGAESEPAAHGLGDREVDPGFGTRGVVGGGRRSVVLDGADDE